jgi:hypothetical protein
VLVVGDGHVLDDGGKEERDRVQRRVDAFSKSYVRYRFLVYFWEETYRW